MTTSMKNIGAILLIVLLACSLTTCGGGGGGGNGGTPTNSVWGHALLSDSNDHSGITVSLEGTLYSTVTDTTGYYLLLYLWIP